MSEQANPEAATGKKGVPWRPLILLAAVLAVMALAWFFNLGQRLSELQGWIRGLGVWGPAVFVLLYAAATVAALPGVALSAVAGGLFGSLVGTIAVSLGSTLGAGLAFLVARYLARSSVESWLGGKKQFRRLDALTEEQGPVIVALTRLVPLFPFNLLNFGFGLTRVPFWTFLFYSWLCMLPGTVLYVVGFDAMFTAIKRREAPWLLIAVLALMALILFLLVRAARGRLRSGPERGGEEAP